MSSQLRYNVNGCLVTRIEAIRLYTELALSYPEPEKSAFLSMIAQQFENDRKMDNTKTKWQTIVVPLIGIILLLFSVYMAFIIPSPTKYQSGVLWVLVSVAAAISSYLIAGSIEYTNKVGIKAVGGFAVFVIMYFFVPKIYDKTDTHEMNTLAMFVLISDSSNLERVTVDFERNSSSRLTELAAKQVSNYFGSHIKPTDYTCFRSSDGKIYDKETCKEIGELEILMISNTAFKNFKDKRQVYRYYKQRADSLSKKG